MDDILACGIVGGLGENNGYGKEYYDETFRPAYENILVEAEYINSAWNPMYHYLGIFILWFVVPFVSWLCWPFYPFVPVGFT